ncbi:MAG: hypothetical protein HYY14_00200 [Candidatus Omnitrophica bacterium]|nr:hypothetical protein [Candidatus Omnitrophota bacterium]
MKTTACFLTFLLLTTPGTGLIGPSLIHAGEAIQLASLADVSPDLAQASIPRISMNMQEVELKDLLKAFSQQSGLNFIAGEEVKERKVTLYVSEVSVEDALTSIINATGLTYRQLEESDIFIVDEPPAAYVPTETRIFKLQYARVTGFGFAVQGGGAGTSLGGSSGGATSQLLPSLELEQSGEPTEGIDKVIEEMLSEHGKLVADQRTNSLIVTDTPERMETIAETIARLDSRTPQVMIAADILDTTTQIVDDIGFEWGTGTDGEVLTASGASRPTSWPFNLGIGRLSKFNKGTDGTITAGTLGFNSLDMTLDLLTQNTDTEILARPRILTLANEAAVIKLTTQASIANVTTVAETSSGLGAEAQNTAERVETGISLRVTPQVNDFGYITMLVEPSVIDTKPTGLSGASFLDPRIRSSKSTVRVTDGETIVIGGLISKDNTETIRKVPLLGDMPLVGYLFTRVDHNDTDRELVMFITPHVVQESNFHMAGGEFVPGGEVSVSLDRPGADAMTALGGMGEREQSLLDYAGAHEEREIKIDEAVKRLTDGIEH